MLNGGPLCVHLRIPKAALSLRELLPHTGPRPPPFLVRRGGDALKRGFVNRETSVSPADVQQVAIDAALLWRHERARYASEPIVYVPGVTLFDAHLLTTPPCSCVVAIAGKIQSVERAVKQPLWPHAMASILITAPGRSRASGPSQG